MDPALRQLTELLPPPAETHGRIVNWSEHELALGFVFPSWLKELIATYGGSTFFDNYSILYPAPECYNVASFRQAVQDKLELLVTYGVTDEDANPIQVAMYPEPGGLFPFMVNYSGHTYFWRMEHIDSDNWPLLCWEMDSLRTLKYATLAEMFLDKIEEVKTIQPTRVRVDPWFFSPDQMA